MVTAARPLALNTRPEGQARELSDLLRAAGLEPVEAPATRVVATWSTESVAPVAERLRRGAYGWTVLPGANAAAFLLEALSAAGGSIQDLNQTRILCGSATAGALAHRGVRATRTLERFSAAAALDVLQAAEHVRGVLVPRAAEGRDELADGLRAHGGAVEELVLYRTEPVEPAALSQAAELLRRGQIRAVAFASPSAVRGLVEGLRALGEDAAELLSRVGIACIGETTASAVAAYGLPAGQVAERTSAEALAQAVVAVVSARGALAGREKTPEGSGPGQDSGDGQAGGLPRRGAGGELRAGKPVVAEARRR